MSTNEASGSTPPASIEPAEVSSNPQTDVPTTVWHSRRESTQMQNFRRSHGRYKSGIEKGASPSGIWDDFMLAQARRENTAPPAITLPPEQTNKGTKRKHSRRFSDFKIPDLREGSKVKKQKTGSAKSLAGSLEDIRNRRQAILETANWNADDYRIETTNVLDIIAFLFRQFGDVIEVDSGYEQFEQMVRACDAMVTEIGDIWTDQRKMGFIEHRELFTPDLKKELDALYVRARDSKIHRWILFRCCMHKWGLLTRMVTALNKFVDDAVEFKRSGEVSIDSWILQFCFA